MTRYHTTGEVAQLLSVSTKTVRTWVDKGLLAAERMPGRGRRRIKAEVLEEFAQQHGLSIATHDRDPQPGGD